MSRSAALISACAAAVFITAAAPLLAQPEFDFMPDGGRGTLLALSGSAALDLREVLSAARSEEEWTALVSASAPATKADERDTLASYLAVNMPLAADVVAGAANAAELSAALPPDGKELAIANCQFCHSFFTGYLVQDRDVQGWRSVFKSPFHMELPMTAKERETFARYSAINMPIPYDKVPEDLRF